MMKTKMKKDDLKEHIFFTYVNLRIGISVLGFLLPILLISIGSCQNIKVQDSLSSYYHAYPEDIKTPEVFNNALQRTPNDASIKNLVRDHSYMHYHKQPWGSLLRSIFVGFLFALGIALYLYKGYSTEENIALNMAGLFALGVAIFPMTWESAEGDIIFQGLAFKSFPILGKIPYLSNFTLHGTCAVLLVALVGYVCIYRASDTLNHLEGINAKLIERFKMWYKIFGWSMVIFSIAAALYALAIKKPDKAVLFVEIVVLIVFSTYWLVKSYEISLTNSDRLALDGQIET